MIRIYEINPILRLRELGCKGNMRIDPRKQTQFNHHDKNLCDHPWQRAAGKTKFRNYMWRICTVVSATNSAEIQ